MNEYAKLFNCFLENIENITQMIKPYAAKCGLNESESLLLLIMKGKGGCEGFFSEKLLNNLEKKGMLKSDGTFELTSKGEIVAKSIYSSLSR